LYFPSVTANFGGNSIITSACLEIVAQDLTFGGNFTFQISGCPSSILSQVNGLKRQE
jgi:hypothetical protein